MVVDPRQPRDIPPLWLLLALGAMTALHLLAPLGVVVAPPWHRLGFLVLAVAFGLLAASAAAFRRAGTGIRPFTPATNLVAGGPFAFTRNPMYLGLVGLTVGTAICLGTGSPFAVPPLFFLVLDRRFVRREEAFLRQRFGSAYDDYCKAVRRWF